MRLIKNRQGFGAKIWAAKAPLCVIASLSFLAGGCTSMPEFPSLPQNMTFTQEDNAILSAYPETQIAPNVPLALRTVAQWNQNAMELISQRQAFDEAGTVAIQDIEQIRTYQSELRMRLNAYKLDDPE